MTFYSFIYCVLNSYCVPDTLLGIRNKATHKTDQNSCPRGASIQCGKKNNRQDVCVRCQVAIERRCLAKASPRSPLSIDLKGQYAGIRAQRVPGRGTSKHLGLCRTLPGSCLKFYHFSAKSSASDFQHPHSFCLRALSGHWSLLCLHTHWPGTRVEGKAEVHILHWLLDLACGVRSVPTVELAW